MGDLGENSHIILPVPTGAGDFNHYFNLRRGGITINICCAVNWGHKALPITWHQASRMCFAHSLSIQLFISHNFLARKEELTAFRWVDWRLSCQSLSFRNLQLDILPNDTKHISFSKAFIEVLVENNFQNIYVHWPIWFKADLYINWDYILVNMNTEEKWECFNEILNKNIHQCIPLLNLNQQMLDQSG